jgi:hypothetical protein
MHRVGSGSSGQTSYPSSDAVWFNADTWVSLPGDGARGGMLRGGTLCCVILETGRLFGGELSGLWRGLWCSVGDFGEVVFKRG